MADDEKPPGRMEPSIDDLLGAPPAPAEEGAAEAPVEGATRTFGLKLDSWMMDIAVADLLGAAEAGPPADKPIDALIQLDPPVPAAVAPIAAGPFAGLPIAPAPIAGLPIAPAPIAAAPIAAPFIAPAPLGMPAAALPPTIDPLAVPPAMPEVIFAKPLALAAPLPPSRVGMVIGIVVLVVLLAGAGVWFALGQPVP
jgi:hypothetical protein